MPLEIEEACLAAENIFSLTYERQRDARAFPRRAISHHPRYSLEVRGISDESVI